MKYMLLLGIDPAIERDKLVSEFTNAKRVALSGREFSKPYRNTTARSFFGMH